MVLPATIKKQVGNYRSKFFIATGPRGAGKTLRVTALACEKLLLAYYLNKYHSHNTHVWCNYPVGFWHTDLISGVKVYLKVDPLDMEDIYTFSDELSEGWIIIDEIDLWFDRQEWNNPTQKAIAKTLQQIRKRKISIAATIQSMNWLNARGQFQLDVVCQCRDNAFSPWGRANRLPMGTIINLEYLDKSGVMTGTAFNEVPRLYTAQMSGTWLHDKYDTDWTFDPVEAGTRYKFKVKTKQIDFTDDDEPEPGYNEALISDAIYDYVARGELTVDKKSFLSEVIAKGCTLARIKIFPVLESFGVYTCGTGKMQYNFSEVTF